MWLAHKKNVFIGGKWVLLSTIEHHWASPQRNNYLVCSWIYAASFSLLLQKETFISGREMHHWRVRTCLAATIPFVQSQCLRGDIFLPGAPGACSYYTSGGELEVHDYHALTTSFFFLRHYDLFLDFLVHSTLVYFFPCMRVKRSTWLHDLKVHAPVLIEMIIEMISPYSVFRCGSADRKRWLS